MLKLSHVVGKNGDMHFSVPAFDFMFKVTIPKPNKDRLIVQRDMSGRILASRVPKIYDRFS